MQISLRSHLIAGTAAVVGASAIAMTPVMGAQLSLPSINVPTVANVTLAGLDSPLSQILETGLLGGQLLFNTDQSVADPGLWGPIAFGIQEFVGIPVGWLENPLNGGFSSIGLLPQIIDDALPIVRQLGINGSDYLNVTVAALSAAGIALSEGVWNAAGDLLTLDIPGALTTLGNAISAAGTLALGAGAYVLSNVVARAQAVVGLAIASAGYLVEATVAQIGAVVARTVQIVEETFAATTFEDGWNTAIDGIFGPTGIPGLVLNLTIGAGQQTDFIPPGEGPNVNGTEPLGTNYIPSTRAVVQSAVKQVAGALTVTATSPLAAEAPAAPAALAASAASARAAAVEAAPAAEAPAADSSEAAPAAEAAEAPAAEVAAPKPARKAARAVRASA